MSKLILLGTFCFLLLAGCSKTEKPNAKEILNDPETRQEVYDAILENKEHSKELLKQMLKKPECSKIASKDGVFARMICLSPAADSLVQKDAAVAESMSNIIFKAMEVDTAMCRNVCDKMMSHPVFKKFMDAEACAARHKKQEK